MHPILFTFPESLPLIGGKALHVYGIMVALGFLMGLLWIKRESRREGLNEETVSDLFFYVLIAGLIGSRLLYFINSSDHFWGDPLSFFRIWEGGLVFQGGVIASVLTTIWYCRRHHLSFFQIADVFSPALALGHAFGRIGCFFAGCCYGRQCDPHFALAMIFPDRPDAIAPPGIPLYPTQLIESLGEFLILAILMTYRRKKSFTGAVFLLYIILYAILRSSVEVLRGDTIRGYVIEPYLSVAQFISGLTLLTALVLWQYLKNSSRQKS